MVQINLKNAFPEKSESERKEIEIKHFRFLADLFLESIKSITMSSSYVKRHLKFVSTEVVEKLHEKGQSFIIVMGHQGNWELAGPIFSLMNKHKLNVVYKPLSNPHFEKLFTKARTKFNTMITPMNNIMRVMAKRKKELDATAFIADQTPSDPKTGTWIHFLNHETLVFTGIEKLSKMFDYPVVYMNVDRVSRGQYEIIPTLLFDNPKETEEFEITKVFFDKLEEEIIRKPETWLWSHKRWKHKRVTTND